MTNPVTVVKHTIIYTQDTSYRLKPNPDADDGFAAGAVLEWSDDGGREWTGHFYLHADALRAMGKALIDAADEADGNG